VRQGVIPQTIWTYEQAGSNQDAKKELVRSMDFTDTSDVFVTPKPVKLLQRILQVATDRDSIVLDSFAGSGTTGHAVLKQNAEDGGDRRFVLVEMEDYASSLTAERVRRVIRGEDGQPTLGPEAGFDFYALGEELFTKYGDEVNPEVGRELLSRFVLFLETGVAAPSVSVNGTGYVGRGGGKDVYVFYEPGTTTALGHRDLATLPPSEGERVVYADRCTVDPEALQASGVTFRKIPRDLQDLIARYNGEPVR